MDIQIFKPSTLKIKSKKTTLAFDPQKHVSKFDADAVILTGKENDISRITNFRTVIDGPGEYEVTGLKISGLSSEGALMYELNSESSSALVSSASALNKVSADKLGDYSIVILNADEELNQTSVTAMEPRIVVLYGDKKEEGAKVLGASSSKESSKITLSEEKFPEELEVVLLG